ncbi:LysR family transcriptional regulator [Pseudoalteromonas byunsanensis]|uniref:LysR family transcriptional regulator n=1 Tax=Pseudoalteromonas byunsanensis TaxID=327939 RepID=A0A1S1N9Y1_9GAMM|nr:LysR family transcriptional regulator [Pseudoalteromonas byunsanensis]OHU95080.1 LysR family transcriptional regulator [Pseudoalteromonas byunsanensis]
MDIDALRSFLAFVETGSFTRAAKQVNRTQSAISMQMKKLEQDLSKSLFQKQGRLLNLSYDGQIFARYAKQLVQLHDDTLAQMNAAQPSTLLRLGCPDDYAESVLPKIVELLHQQWSNLDLQITCTPSNRVKIMIDSGHLDLAIITRSSDSEEGYLLESTQGVWVYNPKHNAQNKHPLPIAIFQRDCRFHQGAIEGLHKLNRAFKIFACSGSAIAQRGLVRNGFAIGAMSPLSKGDLTELHCSSLPTLPIADVVLIRANSQQNPVSDNFCSRIANCYANNEVLDNIAKCAS